MVVAWGGGCSVVGVICGRGFKVLFICFSELIVCINIIIYLLAAYPVVLIITSLTITCSHVGSSLLGGLDFDAKAFVF